MGERFLRPTKEGGGKGHETLQVESRHSSSSAGGNEPPSPAPPSPLLPPPFRAAGEMQVDVHTPLLSVGMSLQKHLS